MRSVNGQAFCRATSASTGRLQLSGKERIVVALIDKRRHGVLRPAGLHQRAAVPGVPCRFIRAEIGGKRFLAPGTWEGLTIGAKAETLA
ncbi:Uncharacterised protein [Klebsiella pneumoniae]|uniref:Uncharacterized protein n=1 Tax=Klebsiella pneumoniae TaxID=573 RepID=A0A378C2Y8_KLEPN|nr:Uncharacterised protein [Klebsiella pneumoniae]